MKALLTILLLAITIVSKAQGDESRYLQVEFEFEEGSEELLYGDNVVLRKKANKDSKSLDTLSIGDKVTIVEMSNETVTVNGLESNWYKVKTNSGKMGYIAGGLISMDHQSIGEDTYLIILAGNSESEDPYSRKVRCRVLSNNGEFHGKELELTTWSFTMQVYDDREMEGVKNMVRINMMAEACGMQGSDIYLFNDGEKLIKAIELNNVSEAGLFWYDEMIKFPDETYWGSNTCYYERELGEYINEELNISKAVTYGIPITWDNGAFSPNPKEIDFEGEE